MYRWRNFCNIYPKEIGQTIKNSFKSIHRSSFGRHELNELNVQNNRATAVLTNPPSKHQHDKKQYRRFAIGIILISILVMSTHAAYADSNAASIAYRSNTGSGLNFPKYREWNASTLSWDSEVELPSAGSPVRFAWLEFSPISAKRVIVTLSDDGFLDSYVCSSACTTDTNWTVTNDIVDLWTTALTGAQRPFDMKFEDTSGDLILVYDRVTSTSTDDLFYRIMTSGATSFGAESTIDDTTDTDTTDEIYSFVRMASKSGTDSIGMIALDQSASDAIAFIWGGSSWGNQHELTATASIGTEEVIGVDWERSSGDLIIVSGEGTASMRYNQFTSSWGTSATFGTWAIGIPNWVTLKANPVSTSNEMFVAAVGDSLDMDTAYWSGSAWTDHSEHDAAVDSHAARIVDFSWNGDNSEGVLIWGTATTSLSFKRFTATSTFTSSSTFSETGPHPWVQLASPPNPTTADTVSALGAVLDSTFDVGGIRWDGGTNNPVSTGDGGITADTTVSTYESFKVAWQRFQSASVLQELAETLTATDSRNNDPTKALSETLALVDAIANNFGRTLAETLTFVDALANAYTKSLTETISLSDALTTTAQFIRNLNESLALADTNVRAFSRKLDETLTLSDTANARITVKNLGETVGLADAVDAKITVKNLQETVALSDTANARITVKNLGETVGIADAVAKSAATNLTETLTLSDTANARITVKNLSETVGIAGTATTTSNVTKNLSETVGLAGTATTTSNVTKNLSETVGLAGTVFTSSTKILSETLALSDTANARISVKNLSETLTVTDTVVTMSSITKSLSETLIMVDSTIKSVSKQLTETLGVSDTANTQAGVTRTLTETLTLTDNIYKSNMKRLDETLVFTDAISKSVIKQLSDTLSLTDSIIMGQAITQTLTETIGLTADLSTQTGAIKSLAESIGLTDNVLKSMNKQVSETLAFTDVIAKSTTKVVTEILSLGDTLTAGQVVIQILNETLSLGDTVNSNSGSIVQLFETVGLTDIVSTLPSNILNLVENIGLGDVVSTGGTIPSITTVAESTRLYDSIELTHTTPMAAGTSITNSFLGGQGIAGGGTITFSEVTNPGTLSATTSTVVQLPPSGFTIVGLNESTKSIDITTTAGLVGTAQICLTYNDTGLAPAQEALLQLRHFTGGVWVNVTTSLNTTDNIICGQTDSLSPFAVMFSETPATAESGGSKAPRYEIVDTKPPEITNQYYKPTVPVEGREVTVTANIIDDVGVSNAHLFYFITAEEFELHKVAMQKYNSEFFIGEIPASDVRTDGLKYWIYAEDFAGNNVHSPSQKLDVQEAPAVPDTTPMNLPAHVLEAIKPKTAQPVEKLEVVSTNSGNIVKSYTDKIVIKNTGNVTVNNIRMMLSPEISKSFKLSDTTIKSIGPNGNVTITLDLSGNPNRDMYRNLVGYNGELMVMAEHHSPIILPVNIGAEKTDYLSAYLEKVAEMGKQRYNKLSLLNDLLPHRSVESKDFELTTSSGTREIASASDELIIKNTSNKEIKNVRIIVSKQGNMFLVDKSNIKTLAPNESVTIKLIPKMDSTKYSPKDFTGQIIVVGDNGLPDVIPVRIVGEKKQKDSIDEYEVRTMMSGNNTITQAVDKITIKNIGNRTMDSVKLILPDGLDRILRLSDDSFQTIASGEEVTIDLRFKATIGEKKELFMQNYSGELTIVSEHHNLRKIPIKIEWDKLESEHFIVYARSGDESVAKQVIDTLENNYQNITSRFGEMKTKTKIYIAGNMDEMKIVNDPSGHPYYSYTDDTIFIYASDDVEQNATKEFVYRLIINNYASYHNMKKFMFDNENWLMDGISSYIASNTTGTTTAKDIDAFKEEPIGFQWYGYGSDAQYGATHTFFEYLESKYGTKVIDKTLYYLGSGMNSNHRCDTLEDCTVLRAVYDAAGLDINKKRWTLDVKTIISEWEGYVEEHYNVKLEKEN